MRNKKIPILFDRDCHFLVVFDMNSRNPYVVLAEFYGFGVKIGSCGVRMDFFFSLF